MQGALFGLGLSFRQALSMGNMNGGPERQWHVHFPVSYHFVV